MPQQNDPNARIRYGITRGNTIQPRAGFAWPAAGDRITALRDYMTCAAENQTSTLRIPARETGVVIALRKPGSQTAGEAIGLIARFRSITSAYPDGIVIFWDWASDPTRFAYRKAPGPRNT